MPDRYAVSVPHEMVRLKPKHGEACNRCGLCCTIELCELAQVVFDRPFRPGPCPALLGGAGTASCGMINDPARFAPDLVAEHGVATMSRAAGVLINAGFGCDSRIGGEKTNDDYELASAVRRILHDDGVEEAFALYRYHESNLGKET